MLHLTPLPPCSLGSHQISFSSLVTAGSFPYLGLCTCFSLISDSLLAALGALILILQVLVQRSLLQRCCLLILKNERLLTNCVKTSLVKKGPDGAAGTSLGWMVRTWVPFLMRIKFPTDFHFAPHICSCWPVKFCTQFQCGIVCQIARQFSDTSWVCRTIQLEIASDPTG